MDSKRPRARLHAVMPGGPRAVPALMLLAVLMLPLRGSATAPPQPGPPLPDMIQDIQAPDLPTGFAPFGLPVIGADSAILLLLAGGIALSLGLAGLAYRRSLRDMPAPGTNITPEDMREMRRAVSTFATLLRDGSSLLMKTNSGTLESANRLAAQSEQLVALLAGAEARVLNATERSEILATRVARSAAAEIKEVVKNLAEVSARIEEKALSRPADVP